MIVVDASVAAKWFVEEAGSDKALRVLEGVQQAPHEYAVPELFFVEMLNVLARVEPSAARVRQHLTDLQDLGLVRLGHSSEMMALASSYATEKKLSGYDATYAATAKLLHGVWLTADERAHRKIATLKLSRLL